LTSRPGRAHLPQQNSEDRMQLWPIPPRRALALAALALAALAATLWLRPERPARMAGFLPHDDARVTAEGASLYATHCAACHGAALEGEPDWQSPGPDGRLPAPPHDATGHTWHHPDEQLFFMTKHGVAALVGGGYDSAMPAFEGVLTDAEILAVLAFIKSTWPDDIRAWHDELNRRTEAANRP
jgi:mono/diheme cytochrome c family protein